MEVSQVITPNTNLILAREKMNMTQEEVAIKIGVDQSSISKYERGLCLPSAPRMKLLADLYGESILWLFF